ncbi:unnamed protein product [marine sediment metagenome]|uniref:Uncharacterized protein n=1 Tax=marine sediment metagenome TaxID=412755 RepID=X1M2U6_9ZZZZ
MTDGLDIPEIVLRLIPIVIVIAKTIISGRPTAEMTPEIQAAVKLFDAMIDYLEVAT